MMSQSPVTSEVGKILAEYELKMKNDPTLKEYQKALKEFKEMIAAGLASPRGNQLRSIEERYIATASLFGNASGSLWPTRRRQ
jgi:hypothetical protein